MNKTIFTLMLFGFTVCAWSAEQCPPIRTEDLVWDYNDSRSEYRINGVEMNHFNEDVEHLRKGMTAPLPRDIDFVLRYVPNHYRALTSMAEWQSRNPGLMNTETTVLSVDCYFQRAITFRPSDSRLHVLYAVYLQKNKRLNDAREQYDLVAGTEDETADVFYNRGLLELDLGNIEAAKKYADQAYALGYPLPGLKNRLNKAQAQGTSKPKP